MRKLFIILILLGCTKEEEDMSLFFDLLVASSQVNYESVFISSDTHKIYDGRTVMPPANVINLVSDGVSFNQIRDAINAITGATALNPYKVNLTGTFKELDVQAKDYVWLNSDNDAVIETDGNWTEITPADYTFATYQSVAFNTVPQAFKHGIWFNLNMILTGITFDSTNVKYNIHQDSSVGAYHSIVDNCHLKKTEVDESFTFNAGIGLRENQIASYWNCTREYVLTVGSKTADYRMFFCHNTLNQTDISSLELIRCEASDSNLLIYTEQDSTQADLVFIKSCTDTLVSGEITYQKKTGGSNLVVVDIQNTNINYVETIL